LLARCEDSPLRRRFFFLGYGGESAYLAPTPRQSLEPSRLATPLIETQIEIEIIHNNTGKLDRLLSIGPLYLAIRDLWVSFALFLMS
jgi:hypothetical protein